MFVCVGGEGILYDLRRFAAVNLFRTEWSNVTKHRILYKFVLWRRLLNTAIFLQSRLVPRQRMISDENQTPRILQTKTQDPNFSLFASQRQADRNWGNGRKPDGGDS